MFGFLTVEFGRFMVPTIPKQNEQNSRHFVWFSKGPVPLKTIFLANFKYFFSYKTFQARHHFEKFGFSIDHSKTKQNQNCRHFVRFSNGQSSLDFEWSKRGWVANGLGFKSTVYSGDLYSNGRIKVGRQMITVFEYHLNTAQPKHLGTWDKQMPSCFLMYWSSIRMVVLIHRHRTKTTI